MTNSDHTRSGLQVSALPCVSALVVACLLARPVLSADERLTSVIRNVEDNEELYRNLDVQMQTRYDIGDRQPLPFEGRTEIVRKAIETHFVRQDDLFRLEAKGSEFDGQETRSSRDKIRVFGGEKTKLLERNTIGNLISGRAEDDEFVLPHLLLLRTQATPVPLSVYLQGHKAIAAIAGGKYLEGFELDIAYGGEGEFDGLKCHRIMIETRQAGSENPTLTKTELWLAEHRNYLPIRYLMWDLRLSADLPRVDGVVSELRELKPGIWFPIKARKTSYQQTALRFSGEQLVQWNEEYFVDSVSLDPQYSREYFNDFEFPDGTAVYEVENGEVRKSYRIGAPSAPDGPQAASFGGWWLVWANLATLGVIAALLVWRRRRGPKSPAGSIRKMPA